MKKVFVPKSSQPHSLSRSKVDLFLECPRCFYLDQKMGVKRPSLPGFSLNNAVDTLLKKEFDLHRQEGTPHPLMKKFGIEAVPAVHQELDNWRNNFKGIRFHHPETNLELFGAIDDLWENPKKEYHIVDYKATSTNQEISLDDKYKQGYRRQIEFYQWLLRRRGFPVSKTSYFVFCNARKDKERFAGRLEFNLTIIEHQGNDSWVEPTILKIKELLEKEEVPKPAPGCLYCDWAKSHL